MRSDSDRIRSIRRPRHAFSLLLLISATTPSIAKDLATEPSFQNSGFCETEEVFEIAFPELSSDEMQAAASDGQLVAAIWPQHHDTLITALILPDAKTSDHNVTLAIATLSCTENGAARTAFVEHHTKTLRWSSAIQFDFADWKITKTDVAFGVRISSSYFSTGHSSHWEDLVIFRTTGNRIVPIFENTMSGGNREFHWEYTQVTDDGGTHEESEQTVVEITEYS